MSARASCRSAPAATPNTSRCPGARCASCRRTSISKRRRASPIIRSPIICCTPRRAASPGKTALIDVASGGLGSAAIQLAKLAGMTAIGLVGSDEKARALKAYGADHAINHRTEDVAARVAAITGGAGVDLVLNAAGGESLNRADRHARAVRSRRVVRQAAGAAGRRACSPRWIAGRAISAAPQSAFSPCTRSTTSPSTARSR